MKIAPAVVLLVTTSMFAPNASSVPAFARQTKMACSACHFQHFSSLNTLGRAFKSDGFTQIGVLQGKVEDMNVDIPDRLNMSALTSVYWQDESQAKGGANPQDQPHWGLPSSGGEMSIFYGGRIAKFGGFLSEINLQGTATTSAAKLVLLFPVADMRIGLVTYSGDRGAAYSFETLNTGATDTHKMMSNAGANKEHAAAAYSATYLGTAFKATGVSVVANNYLGFVNIGKYAPLGTGTDNANDLPLYYARIVGNLDILSWDIGVGIQRFYGDAKSLTAPATDVFFQSAPAPGADAIYEANIIDVQAQGELMGMATGLYISYGSAPSNAGGNLFVGGNGVGRTNSLLGGGAVPLWYSKTVTGLASGGHPSIAVLSEAQRAGAAAIINALAGVDTSVTTLNAAVSVEILYGATLQAAMRMANLNYADTQDVGWRYRSANKNMGAASFTDNAFMLGVTYDFAHNVTLGLNHTMQSGSTWDELATPIGKTMTTILLEAVF